jgi:hypothetical protein
MKFLVDKVALKQSFVYEIPLTPVSMIHQCYIIICIYVVLLPEGQAGSLGAFKEIKSLWAAGEIGQKTTLFFYLVTKVNNILSISGVRVMVLCKQQVGSGTVRATTLISE